METTYLTAEEALHALADGQVLENDDGVNVLLDGNLVVMRYTMGKNNTLVTQNYNGSFDKFLSA
jgi:phosphoribosylformylglycinamidine (FGAM) synthase-like amidotransferase family enzyme